MSHALQTPGSYVPRLCVFCDKLITYADTLVSNGVQVLDFHQASHRRCYLERFSERRPAMTHEVQRELDLFDTERPSEAAAASSVAHPEATA